MNPSAKKAERLLQIESLLLAHPSGLTQADLARRLGVHRSTINRYIADLPGHIYIEDDGRWCIDRQAMLVNLRLSLNEALAVHLASRLLATRMDRQNPHAAAALRKLGEALGRVAPEISRHVQRSADLLDDPQQRSDPAYIQVLETLTLAWAEQRKVRLEHRRAGDDKTYTYVFAPYFIEPYAVGQSTHVIGRRDDVDNLRTFKIERIVSATLLTEQYAIPPDFDPAALLRDAWGIWYSDTAPQTVKLRFMPGRAAARVQETDWHTTQSITVEEDGAVVWTADVAEPQEMVPWIRGWGADVEVLAPETLRQQVMAHAARLAARYGLGPATASGADRVLRLWGKTSRADPELFHPAVYHMIDVANVAYWLLSPNASPRWRTVLAEALGATAQQLQEWLPFLIALHDIGKLSVPHQLKSSAQAARLQREGFEFGTIVPSRNRELHHTTFGALALEEDPWIQALPRSLRRAVLVMVAGHHGHYPKYAESRRDRKLLAEPAEWAALRDVAARHLHDLFIAREPAVWPEPAHVSAAVATLTGFTILCDWLGSDETFFPARPQTPLLQYMAHSRRQAHARLQTAGFFQPVASQAPTAFTDLFGFAPRPLQRAIDDIPDTLLAQPTLTIIEAPTGEGKTEAALALSHRIGRLRGTNEMYIALPTTATSNAMYGRIQRFLVEKLRLPNLAKLIHGQDYVESDLRLDFEQLLDDAYDGTPPALDWFAPKKQALLAPFGVGTVDQAELAALNVRHHALRLIGLAGKTVILDEVHAYDTYMTTIIARMLAWLGRCGTSVILLSATLPLEKRAALAQAYAGTTDKSTVPDLPDAYPSLVTVGESDVYVATPPAAQPARVIGLHALHFGDDDCAKARWLLRQIEDGGCAAWITNTVGRAQTLFTAIQCVAPDDVSCTLLHARLPLAERQAREAAILHRYGPQAADSARPAKGIVIGTQVLEQSLDVDFDVLVSDLAPIDLLLQRAGRLHRHTARTDRAAAQTAPILHVHADIDQAGHLVMGDDRFYGEYLLRLTWREVRARTATGQPLTLPDDYRPLIEAVYAAANPSGDAVLTAAQQEMAARQQRLEDEAKQRLVPSPDPRTPYSRSMAATFREDEDGSSWIVAQTRYSERPSLTIIPLERLDADRAGLPDGSKVALNGAADRATQLRLLKQQLRVSAPGVVHALLSEAEARPAVFARSALLRSCHPLWLTDGANTDLNVRLDPVLGLVLDAAS